MLKEEATFIAGGTPHASYNLWRIIRVEMNTNLLLDFMCFRERHQDYLQKQFLIVRKIKKEYPIVLSIFLKNNILIVKERKLDNRRYKLDLRPVFVTEANVLTSVIPEQRHGRLGHVDFLQIRYRRFKDG